MNYKQLQEIHVGYRDKGLAILCFPCNQFGKQEPGSNEAIKAFIKGYSFEGDIFGKINVNGSKAIPLYKFLKKKQGGTLGSFIKWNFTKFLIDRDGTVTERFGPSTKPNDILKTIKVLLDKPPSGGSMESKEDA